MTTLHIHLPICLSTTSRALLLSQRRIAEVFPLKRYYYSSTKQWIIGLPGPPIHQLQMSTLQTTSNREKEVIQIKIKLATLTVADTLHGFQKTCII
jgi:hypothetical protein